MNHLFLLKLIAELLSSDKPTADEIGVVKKVIKEMIEENEPQKQQNYYTSTLPIDKNLDLDAQKAKQELTQ